ncbi:endolytic transglycosylase MltG [Rossellomorea vietnamensis]|uniref:Endolytic transglycosylase MltG n=1 Tax=Rossellomorea vietnamensis TaxID=218284 RepID=A0ACD4C6L9_9BACI|nr:endolytic transglycosylase MltG [Rossellomorea vietnamensis]UXH44310.1 endolytic transglycosylase MltG [Rossellomorea vietnamensis]WQI95704.1 endolytic transglycosylase MltG [Rossellomorea vietnamensis]
MKALEEKKKIKETLMKKLLERQEEAKVIRKVVGLVILCLVIIIGGTAIGGYLYVNSALKPVDPDNTKTVKVDIPIGSGVSSIGKILEDKGIVKNSTVFKYYVKFNNEAGFQAGSYDLTPSMTLNEIVNSLKTGKVMRKAEFKITIPEGLQLDQIAEIIAEKSPYKKDEIEKKLNDKKWLEQLKEEYPELITDEIFKKEIKRPLEGYLYPATYPFYEKKPSLDTILKKMIAQTNEVLAQYQEAMAANDYTPHELLTLSSLIEEEATEKADRGKISSVFYNRMEEGMPLQTDPTVLYALGKHKDKTVYKDLEVESPYNTYQVKGLPPGPIANAGLSSIEAALQPEDTEYYYFLAASNGSVYYSETLDEHNEKKAKYITNKEE